MSTLFVSNDCFLEKDIITKIFLLSNKIHHHKDFPPEQHISCGIHPNPFSQRLYLRIARVRCIRCLNAPFDATHVCYILDERAQLADRVVGRTAQNLARCDAHPQSSEPWASAC